MVHESTLERALRNDEITVHYQPQVRLDDRSVVGAEALARWQHPDLGLLLADRFVPLAEDAGLVQEIDRSVRGQALDAFAGNRTPGAEISVNVSPLSVWPDMAERLLRELGERSLQPGDLVLEVTERLPVRQHPGAVKALWQVAQVQVRVAMDDFGAGATSVTDLTHLPLHRIKLDRSLTADLTGSRAPQARLVVRAIADLAEHLGIEVMAEGVETEAQAAILVDEGVLLGQGYLFGRPVAAPTAA